MAIRYDVGNIRKGSSSLAEFIWEINNFFSLSQEVNHSISSPEFHFAGAKWRLSMFPNGTDMTEGWTEIWLMKICSRPLNLRVRWEIGIKSHDGTTYKSHTAEQHLAGNFARCGEIMLLGYSEVVERKEVIAPRGILTSFCELRLDGEIKMDISCQTKSYNSAEKLSQDLEELLTNGYASDVTLVVKNEKIKAHKAVLASRSLAFAAMFKHPMKENVTGEVKIIDYDEDVVQSFLHYIYTGKLQETTSGILCRLYDMAEKYGVNEMKVECVESMKDLLTADSFCDVFSIARLHAEKELLAMAVTFFRRNRKEILEALSWETFVTNNPKQAVELLISAEERQKAGDSSG